MHGDVAVLLAAAGGGTRLGLGPKAFVTVRGHTLVDLSLLAVAGLVGEVVVALPAGTSVSDREAFAAAATLRNSGTELRFVAGGATRQESVANMLQASAARTVLVHDVARPFLTPSVLERVATAATATGAASAVIDVVDTVFDVATGTTLERGSLRLVQTPQGFEREVLVAAHAAAAAAGASATDDAELVRRIGRQVALVRGSRLLHKLTTPEDVALAPALYDLWLTAREGGGDGD